MGLRARRRRQEGQARPRRHDRAGPEERNAPRLGGHRSDPEIPPSLQELAEAGRALPRERPGGRAARGRAHGPRHARALPEDVQRHPGGARRDHPRARRGRERGGGLDGRRHADAGAVAQGAPALRLLPPAIRAGHQPAHRQLARIDRDVAADPDRAGMQHLSARSRARPPDRARLTDPLAAQAPPDPRDRGGHARVHRPAVRPRGGAAPGDPAHVRAGRERRAGRQARAAPVGSLPRPGAHACARAARDRGGASAPGEDGTALQVQPAGRDRHGARAAPLRVPHRLRRDRGLPLHGLPGALRDDAQGTRQARFRGAARARSQLPRGPQEGPVQDHVEDGDLDHRQLPQLAAVRDRRARGRGGGPVLYRHRKPRAGRGFRRSRGRPRGARRARLEPARGDRPGRASQVHARRRVPHVQPRRDRGASGGGDLRR